VAQFSPGADKTLADVVERLARLTKQVLSNAQRDCRGFRRVSMHVGRTDLVRLRGEGVIDEVWRLRPFDFSKTYDALARGSG
jgi:hypothetical protein